MLLSIIIPVYNEMDTISIVIKKIYKTKLPCKKELIIVDDGSTDGTKEKIMRYKSTMQRADTPLTIVFHTSNIGKGAAIQTGIGYASGDYILIQDADLEYNPEEIPSLLAPILNQKKKPHQSHRPIPNNQPLTTNMAVYGSRFLRGRPKIPFLYYMGNRFLTAVTNILYGTHLTDMETGYKLLPTSVMKSLSFHAKRFEIEPEITAHLIKHKIPIQEVPISYEGRSHVAGKKITGRDAYAALFTLLRLRNS